MKTILTAEEFKHEHSKKISLGEELMHFRKSKEVSNVMIEFAKLHVERALKEASKKVKRKEGQIADYKLSESILTAYPLDKIK